MDIVLSDSRIQQTENKKMKFLNQYSGKLALAFLPI